MIRNFKKVLESPTLLSWSSVFVRFGSAIFVLPLILKVYSPVEQSFWFFIGTLTSFAMLADSGFGATLVRAVTYFKAGANSIPKTREEFDLKLKVSENGPNFEKLRALLLTSFRVYFYLNAFLVVILLTVGIALIWNIMKLGNHRLDLWIAYFVIIPYCSMMIISVKWSSFARGLGFITLESRFALLQGVLQILVFLIMLSFKLKPVFLLSYMTFQSFSRFFYLRKFVKNWFSEKEIKIGRPQFNKEIFDSLWGATWRLGGLSWGSFAITSGTSIVISQIKDPLMMASFLFTQRIVNLISNLAKAPFYTNVPKIYELSAKKDFKNLKIRSSEYIFLGLFVMFALFGLIILLGNPILAVLHFKTRFVPLTILIVIAVTEILDNHSSYHASIYTSTNHVPFLLPAVLSGAMIILVGFYVLPLYGVLALVLSKLIIQSAFNNWYSVSLSLRLLHWNFFNYMKDLPRYGIKGIWGKIKYFINK